VRKPFLFVPLCALAAGCGVGNHVSAPPPGTTAATGNRTTTVAAPPPQMTLTVYDAALRPSTVRVPRTRAVAAASLRALGVEARVTIANGTARLALANASDAETRAIVYTLTQYPSIRRVSFAGGRALARADVLPQVFVAVPAAGAHVPATFTVSGSASVFEGTLVVELRRAGAVLERRTVTASAGAPYRGRFSTTLHAPAPGDATLAVYAPSQADGSPQHEQDVDVTVGS
jgi:hypothetical protein